MQLCRCGSAALIHPHDRPPYPGAFPIACVECCALRLQKHEGGLLATMDGMHGAADRVKLLVQQQMNDLRKAIDAKEQVRCRGCT